MSVEPMFVRVTPTRGIRLAFKLLRLSLWAWLRNAPGPVIDFIPPLSEGVDQ